VLAFRPKNARQQAVLHLIGGSMSDGAFLDETLNRRARTLAYLRRSSTSRQTKGAIQYPPRIAPIADLALMVGRLWHERRATEPAKEITVPELEPIEEPAPAFAEAVEARAESALDALPPSARFSEWLTKIEVADADARRLAVLLAGQWFEGGEEDIAVAADARQLAEADAYGRSRPHARWQCLMRPPTLPRQCACCCWR
jgi:hypothetical protein